MNALELATLFHETYERLAPEYGYETREDTRTFDATTPNGRLMVAVCGEILRVLSDDKVESQPDGDGRQKEVARVYETRWDECTEAGNKPAGEEQPEDMRAAALVLLQDVEPELRRMTKHATADNLPVVLMACHYVLMELALRKAIKAGEIAS